MTVFFRTIGCLCPDFDYAMKFAAILITLFVLTGGYFIQYNSELVWLRWIFWINPFALGFSVLMMNEFSRISLRCTPEDLVPSGGEEQYNIANQICTLPGSVPGSDSVSGTNYIKAAFSYDPDVMWRNFGIILVMIIAFLFLQATCAELLHYGTENSVSQVSTFFNVLFSPALKNVPDPHFGVMSSILTCDTPRFLIQRRFKYICRDESRLVPELNFKSYKR